MNQRRPAMPDVMLRLLIAAPLAVSCIACGEYRASKVAFDRYQPPALYQALAAEESTPRTPHAPQPVAPHDILLQPQHREQIPINPAHAQNQVQPENAFYQPDAEIFRQIAPALSDDRAAAALLQDGFDLAVLEILTWARNPMVTAAEKNVRASLAAYPQVSHLNDLLRRYAAFTAALMTGVGDMDNMEAISRKFPFPGIVTLKGRVVAQDVEIARQSLEIARRTAITQARQAYWDLWYNHRASAVAHQSLDLMRTLQATTAKRYETGRTSLLEFIKAEIQTEKLSVELINLREEQQNIKTAIRSLLRLPLDVRVGRPAMSTPAIPLPSAETLTPMALQHRQELNQLRAMIRKMELMIEMGETEIYPGFATNLSLTESQPILQAGSMSMSESFPVSTTAAMGQGLPKMPLTGLANAYLQELRQKREAWQDELVGAEAETVMKIREAWFAADRARRESTLYQIRVAELSGLNLTSALKAYESGLIPFAELMDSIQFVLEIRLQSESRQRDIGQTLATVAETIGRQW